MSVDMQTNQQTGVMQTCYRTVPNCSMSERGLKRVFWGVAGMTFVIAGVFAMLGYWLTLPFAGLEIGVLAWAFESMKRHRSDYESLEIVGEELRIESRYGGQLEKNAVNRHWASVVSGKDAVTGHIRLAVRSHGRETVIGQFMNDEDRMRLCRALQGWLGRSS